MTEAAQGRKREEPRGAAKGARQEGWLALIQIARTTNKRHFARTLAHTLPGRVRDAAGRMRRAEGTVSLDEPAGWAGSGEGAGDSDAVLVGETIADPRAEEGLAAVEAASAVDACLAVLTETERATARALAEGRTYGEIAAEANATRQAVANRVRNMRCKLAAVRMNV